MNMRAIIAEDEQVARLAIAAMAKASGMQVLAECGDGAETIRCLQATNQTFCFWTFKCLESTDLESCTACPAPCFQRSSSPLHTTVTRYKHLSTMSWTICFKPFDEERFCRAVERAKLQLMSGTNRAELITHLAALLHTPR